MAPIPSVASKTSSGLQCGLGCVLSFSQFNSLLMGRSSGGNCSVIQLQSKTTPKPVSGMTSLLLGALLPCSILEGCSLATATICVSSEPPTEELESVQQSLKEISQVPQTYKKLGTVADQKNLHPENSA
jgi:hypothetical protein